MSANLSFEQAPPFSVPVRFFLLAPVFGVAAGVLLAWRGGDALLSRWSAETLALTHLLGAGFMLQAMCGALLQFVPVAAGGNVWRPRGVSLLVQPALALGAALLAAGFLLARPPLLAMAGGVLFAGIGGFVAVMALALWRTPASGATLTALRLAVGGLLVTAVLGVALALGLARGWSLPFPALTDVHLAWALGAWALMLLAGVAYAVVPMFQLTPRYPEWLMSGFGPTLFVLVLGWSAAALLPASPTWRQAAAAALLLAAATFALLTLRLQARRRRRVTDATFLLFRYAMLALLGCVALGLLPLIAPVLGEDGRVATTLGILALVGVFVSAITGMLYKIVPFIAWLELQRQGQAAGCPPSALPSMKGILSATAMTAQSRAHLAATALLLAVPWLPWLAVPAGLAFAGAMAWLGANLLAAVRRYRVFTDRIRASGAGRGS